MKVNISRNAWRIIMRKIGTTAYILGLTVLLAGGITGCKKEHVEPDTNVYVYNYGSTDSSRTNYNGGSTTVVTNNPGGNTGKPSNGGTTGGASGGTTGGTTKGSTTVNSSGSGGTSTKDDKDCDGDKDKDKDKDKKNK
jgi:hypothetical protein